MVHILIRATDTLIISMVLLIQKKFLQCMHCYILPKISTKDRGVYTYSLNPEAQNGNVSLNLLKS